MKRIAFVLLCVLSLGLSIQAQSPQLVIRVDDMGSSQSSNEASIDVCKNGIATSVEVMAVGPWFPGAVQMLKDNPTIDVGLHLVLTSEWDNIKWRPLTNCPSLTDSNGYFFPMISPNSSYPGKSIKENNWNIKEIEQEFRAQIELALKNIPRISHLSGHMGCMSFDPKVVDVVRRLAKEYNLSDISTNPQTDYGLIRVSYDGAHSTYQEKEESFIRMLNKLEAGKNYIFLDHPTYNDREMQATSHIGYETVAEDRQGVTDLLINERIKNIVKEKQIQLINYNKITKSLPRSTPKAENVDVKGIEDYLKAVQKANMDLHSLMVLRNGKVVFEKWFGDNAADKNHPMHSVSKTFTSMAVGFAVAEGKLKVTDKVISFFPDGLPTNISPNLAELEVRHLLTMSTGMEKEPSEIRRSDKWEQHFLATPIIHKPGTQFQYSSLSTYMLAAIVQKVSGEKLIDYLYSRLLRPLGITGIEYPLSPSGVNTGGWGMQIKTEDMVKLGQFLLQKGEWNGVQLLPASWIDDASSVQIMQPYEGENDKNSDWKQGYGYQMWVCRHNAFRADGANGQFIVIIPDKNAVVVTTANIGDMQAELNQIWDYILPALK
jgi:CubicO group peptidase (beta-lactamase class C family)/predicted glycoside hydrolase/deacetylase ChbG (UPF0249 family)